MLTTIEKIVFLQKAPIFEQMTSRQLKVLSEVAEEERIQEGEVVFEEESVGDRMYIIVSGRIEILKRIDDHGVNGGQSEQKTLATLEKREIFGEMAILDDFPRSASAMARESSRLLSIRKDDVRELIHDYPDIAFGIFKVLSERVREANRQIELLQQGGRREVVLTVVQEDGGTLTHRMVGDRLVLGRPESSEMQSYDKLSISDLNQEISRRHSELVLADGTLTLRDMGSLNGTWYNNLRLGEDPAVLADGDSFRLGTRTEVLVNWK